MNTEPLNSGPLNGSAILPPESLSDELACGMTLSAAVVTFIADSAAIADAPAGSIITRLFERIRWGALNYGLANQSASMADGLRVLERTAPILMGVVAEAMTTADSQQAQVQILAALVEALRLADPALALRDAVATIALALTLADFAGPFNAAEMAEALLSSDALGAQLLANAAMVEAAALAVALASARSILVRADENILVQGSATATATYLAQLAEGAGFEAEFIIGGDVYQGWVVNTESNAASEYDNFPFNSMCRVGQRYYGASESGLYLLDGDRDDGDPIRTRILTGEMDFGSPNLKRIERAYLGYTTQGDLVLKVIVTHAGKHAEYWYKAAALSSGERTETRVKIGEGLVSRYWQFELVNTDGADFEIDRMDLDVRDLKRRV